MALSPPSSVTSAEVPTVPVLIVAFPPPSAESGFDNTANGAADASLNNFGVRFSDNADGSWIEWDVALGAGTYSLMIGAFPFDGSGILRFSLDGVRITLAPYLASASDYDAYSASATKQVALVATGITIAEGGTYALRATVTGKNASSSGFVTNILHLYLLPA